MSIVEKAEEVVKEVVEEVKEVVKDVEEFFTGSTEGDDTAAQDSSTDEGEAGNDAKAVEPESTQAAATGAAAEASTAVQPGTSPAA